MDFNVREECQALFKVGPGEIDASHLNPGSVLRLF